MAAANYYLCDKCKAKTYYDADVDYEDSNLGAMAALCKDCAQVYEITIAKRGEIAELRAAVKRVLAHIESFDDEETDVADWADAFLVEHERPLRAALAATEGQP